MRARIVGESGWPCGLPALSCHRPAAGGGRAFLPESSPLVPLATPDAQSILPDVPVNVSHDVAVTRQEMPFNLRTFPVRDQDIIDVANAPGAELATFLGLAKLGSDAAGSVYDLKIPR